MIQDLSDIPTIEENQDFKVYTYNMGKCDTFPNLSDEDASCLEWLAAKYLTFDSQIWPDKQDIRKSYILPNSVE